MSAYAIADVEAMDGEVFAEFRERVRATAEPYGGRYLVRAGAVQAVEGDWSPARLIVGEFDDAEQPWARLNSAEFTALSDIRSRSAKFNTIIVSGL